MIRTNKSAANSNVPVSELVTNDGRASSGVGRGFEPITLSTTIFSGTGSSRVQTLDATLNPNSPIMCLRKGRASPSRRR